jgi:hypothetical protein
VAVVIDGETERLGIVYKVANAARNDNVRYYSILAYCACCWRNRFSLIFPRIQ